MTGAGGSNDSGRLEAFLELSRTAARLTGGDCGAVEYIETLSAELMRRTGADVVEWDLRHGETPVRARLSRGPDGPSWTTGPHDGPGPFAEAAAGDPRSAVIPLQASEEVGAFALLRRSSPFDGAERMLLGIFGGAVAAALVNRATRTALRERVKELGCLFGVAQIAARDAERPLAEALSAIAAALPAAWLYPELAAGRIELDGVLYDSHPEWVEVSSMEQGIAVRGVPRGRVIVAYRAPLPPLYEGPFLKEERRLLDAIARELEGIIERREARDERSRLEDQIRHADRLATIGQLAAGVAHELNEPLGAILGFAELAVSGGGLGDEARADVGKIVDASLRARDIVNKLRLFARQSPPSREAVALNEIIQEGLYFTEAQCARRGVAIVRDLDPDLPRIDADRGQMHQVLTNLTVNAMQAMPDGGTLTIRTRRREREVALIVRDTGAGIPPEVRPKIFLPFFTTKPAEQGTGLGLSVVEGIIAGHGGAVEVRDAAGGGAEFEVRLPLPGAEIAPGETRVR